MLNCIQPFSGFGNINSNGDYRFGMRLEQNTREAQNGVMDGILETPKVTKVLKNGLVPPCSTSFFSLCFFFFVHMTYNTRGTLFLALCREIQDEKKYKTR